MKFKPLPKINQADTTIVYCSQFGMGWSRLKKLIGFMFKVFLYNPKIEGTVTNNYKRIFGSNTQ